MRPFHPADRGGSHRVECRLAGGFPHHEEEEKTTTYVVEEAPTLPPWLSLAFKTLEWRPQSEGVVSLELRASRSWRGLPAGTAVATAVPVHAVRTAARHGGGDGMAGLHVGAKALLVGEHEVDESHFEKVGWMDVSSYVQFRWAHS